MKGFATGSQVLEIIHGREMGHFAGSFIFSGLSSFSFRAESRSSQITRTDEAREPALRIPKNSNRGQPMRQDNLDLFVARLAPRPRLDGFDVEAGRICGLDLRRTPTARQQWLDSRTCSG